MPHVEDELILPEIEHPVQGQCQLHDAQIGREMSAGPGHRMDELLPDFPAKHGNLLLIQFFHILRTVYAFQQHVMNFLPSARIQRFQNLLPLLPMAPLLPLLPLAPMTAPFRMSLE